MQPIVNNLVWSISLSVCWSISLSLTVMSPAKTAEPSEIPFGMLTHMGPRKHYLIGCTLAPPGEYDWTVHMQWRCDLMSNYLTMLWIYVLCDRCNNDTVRTVTFEGHLMISCKWYKSLTPNAGRCHLRLFRQTKGAVNCTWLWPVVDFVYSIWL